MLKTRRAFIGALSVLPALGSRAWATDASTAPSQVFRKEAPPITSADQVLNVMDFEPLARKALPPAHFGYIATGADDDRTVAHNHDAFSHYEIRVRRFNDVTNLDTATTVFGTRWTSPLYLSAVSAQGAFNGEGEIATARAAKSRSTHMMLSTGTSNPLEAVRDARGAPIWQQLYPTNDWAVATAIIRRAEAAGCTAIVLTADTPGGRNNETLKRAQDIDNRPCTSCHANNSHDIWRRGREGPHPGVHRWRRPPRHRHLQGAGAGRSGRRHRPAPGMGTSSVRSAGRRSGDRHPQPRAGADDAPGRHAGDREHHGRKRGALQRLTNTRLTHASNATPVAVSSQIVAFIATVCAEIGASA